MQEGQDLVSAIADAQESDVEEEAQEEEADIISGLESRYADKPLLREFLLHISAVADGLATLPKRELADKLTSIAKVLEEEEEKFQLYHQDPIHDSPNVRYHAASVSAIALLADVFYDSQLPNIITDRLLFDEDELVRVASARAFLAAGANTLADLPLDLEAEDERAKNKLMDEVMKGKGPMRAIATGILARMVSGDLGDEAVDSGIVQILVQRLADLIDKGVPWRPKLGDIDPSLADKMVSGGQRPKSLFATEKRKDKGKEDEKQAVERAEGEETVEQAYSEEQQEGKGVTTEEKVDWQLWESVMGLSEDEVDFRELRGIIACLASLGEYQDILAHIFRGRGMESILTLLKSPNLYILSDTLQLINSLLAHKKFANVFVDTGLDVLLSLPPWPYISGGLALCFFELTAVMERILLSPDPSLPSRLVHAAMWLLSLTLQDGARKDTCHFLALVLEYRTVLELFDQHNGLQTTLTILRNSIVLPSPDGVPKKSVIALIHGACFCLRQYFRAHLILQTIALKRHRNPKKQRERKEGEDSMVESKEELEKLEEGAHEDKEKGKEKDTKKRKRKRKGRKRSIAAPASSSEETTSLTATPTRTYHHASASSSSSFTPVIHFGPSTNYQQLSSLIPGHKALNADDKAVEAALTLFEKNDMMRQHLSHSLWPQVEHFWQAQGFALILETIHRSLHQWGYPETGQYGLEALLAMSVVPFTHQYLVGTTIKLVDRYSDGLPPPSPHSPFLPPFPSRSPLPPLSPLPTTSTPAHGDAERERERQEAEQGEQLTAIAVLLRAASVDTTETPAVVNAALHILWMIGGLSRDPDSLKYVWSGIRTHNGIQLLFALLRQRKATPEADHLRGLACKVLLGLARDATICQILSKLHLSETLSELIQSPLAQHRESLNAHLKFRAYALKLIDRITMFNLRGPKAFNKRAFGLDNAQQQLLAQNRQLALLAHHQPEAGMMYSAATREATDPALLKIQKSVIVNETPIQYSQKELLQLIHDHLQSCGLHQSAETLRQESKEVDPALAFAAPTITSSKKRRQRKARKKLKDEIRQKEKENEQEMEEKKEEEKEETKQKLEPMITEIVEEKKQEQTQQHRPRRYSLTSVSAASPSRLAITPTSSPAFLKTAASAKHLLSSPSSTPTSALKQQKRKRRSAAKKKKRDTSLSILPHTQQPPQNVFRNTLDNIVRQFCMDQHRRCAAPISVLPPFPLLHQVHRCPEPLKAALSTNRASRNITSRLFHRQAISNFGRSTCYSSSYAHGGRGGMKLDRRFVFGRFRAIRTFVGADGGVLHPGQDEFFTCARFYGRRRIMVGSSDGQLSLFDVNTGDLLRSWQCGDCIWALQMALNGQYLLTSAPFAGAMLWDVSEDCIHMQDNSPMHRFPDCDYATFNHACTLIAGSDASSNTVLYSIQSSQRLATLKPSTSSSAHSIHEYTPRPCFSPCDGLILSDDVLWDPRYSRMVHKFDRFTSPTGSSVFNPSGREVIINSEVWDLQTFKLLRTIPLLDQTRIVFNALGDVLYAIPEPREGWPEHSRTKNKRFFMTFDATDYSHIATIELGKDVLDLAVDTSSVVPFPWEPVSSSASKGGRVWSKGTIELAPDNQIALVENAAPTAIESGSTVVRLYEVGRQKSSGHYDSDVDEEDDEENDDDDDEDGAGLSFDEDDDDGHEDYEDEEDGGMWNMEEEEWDTLLSDLLSESENGEHRHHFRLEEEDEDGSDEGAFDEDDEEGGDDDGVMFFTGDDGRITLRVGGTMDLVDHHEDDQEEEDEEEEAED
ncbi:hypothetical protein QOT17_022759 [Balamuthia mandrillaris]